MSQVDTTSFARFLMGGLNQGINLGEGIDRMKFARERAGVADQQSQFSNAMAMDEMAMRKAAVLQAAQERAARVESESRRQRADQQVMQALMSDDATFSTMMPNLIPVLADASPGLQRGIEDRGATRRDLERSKAMLEGMRQQGIKISENQAQEYRNKGLPVPIDMLAKTDRQRKEEEDAQDREALIVLAMEDGTITPEEAQKIQGIRSVTLVKGVLDQRRAAAEAAAKVKAEQEAAVKAQAQAQALEPALARYRAGNATEADLIALNQGGLVTASNIGPKAKMEDPTVFGRKRIEDIDREIQFVESQLVQAGIATPGQRAGLPITIDKEKANEGAAYDPWWGDPRPATPEYEQAQALLTRRNQLLAERQKMGQQVVGGAPAPAQPASAPTQVHQSALQARIQFRNQNGRDPTPDELRALLSQGSRPNPR